MHVLVVDDNALNRSILREILKSVGIVASEADDGRAALELLRTRSFDMVFMDIRMPEMDGLEAIELIRRLPGQLGRIPIMVVTADADPECESRARAAGAQDVIHKPVDLNTFLAAVASRLVSMRSLVPV